MKKAVLLGVVLLGAAGGAVEAQDRLAAWDLFCRGNVSADVRLVLTFEDETRKVVHTRCTPGTRALEVWPDIPATRGNVAQVKAIVDVYDDTDSNQCVLTTQIPFTDAVPCRTRVGGDRAEVFFSIPDVP